jgi:hypothetical protein
MIICRSQFGKSDNLLRRDNISMVTKPSRSPQTLKALLESYRIPVPAVTTPAAIEGDNRQLPKGVSTSSNT